MSLATAEHDAPWADAGEVLRRSRVRARMSQHFLGILVGATQQTVSRWEQGLGAPGRTAQGALRDVLDLPAGLWAQPARVRLAS